MTTLDTKRRESWSARWGRSKFVLLTFIPLGLASWAAFVWAGARARRRAWVVYGVLYLALLGLGFASLGSQRTNALFLPLVLGGWLASIVHAFAIRGRYLDATWETRALGWEDLPWARTLLGASVILGMLGFSLAHLGSAALQLQRLRALDAASPCAGQARAADCTGRSTQHVVRTWWGSEGRGRGHKYVVSVDITTPTTRWTDVRLASPGGDRVIGPGSRVTVEWYDRKPMYVVAGGARFRTTDHPAHLSYDRALVGLAALAFTFVMFVGFVPVFRGAHPRRVRRMSSRRPVTASIFLSVGALFGHLWGMPWYATAGASAVAILVAASALPRRLTARA